MFKKIVIGSLLVFLIGFLVFGAINRTLAKTGEQTSNSQTLSRRGATGFNQGVSSELEPDSIEENHSASGLGCDSNGQGGDQARSDEQGRHSGQDRKGKEGSAAGKAEAYELVTIQGTVTQVNPESLVVNTDEGQVLEVSNRAWLYAQELGFSARVGDRLQLVGFYEAGAFEAAQIENLTLAQSVVLRDQDNRPKWSGKARGGGPPLWAGGKGRDS